MGKYYAALQQLSAEWQRCGLTKGDVVLIHSNCIRILAKLRKIGIHVAPRLILESFLDAVGRSGTLILPLFNFDFTTGVPFDIRNTASRMGILTETARLYTGSVRTGHPIYSFAVIGRESKLFGVIDNFSGYGLDSPFGMLRQLDGKIAVLNLPFSHGPTFYHHVEEMHNVTYRYHKVFTGEYTNNTGITTTRSYSLFVRDLQKGVVTHLDPTEVLMWDNGLYTGDLHHEGCGLRVVSANKMYDFVSQIIISGKAQGLLYEIDRASR